MCVCVAPIKIRCPPVHTDLKVLGQRCVCGADQNTLPLITPTFMFWACCVCVWRRSNSPPPPSPRRYFAYYLAVDMALYLMQKVARDDFHYWMPLDGASSLLASLMVRVAIKTITDFTGVIHFRHPYELGGLFWTVNMFSALLVSILSVWGYYKYGEGVAMEQSNAWTLVTLVGGVWTVSFGVFLMLAKKEYRTTFFSTKLGKDVTMNFFRKGKDDEIKVLVFKDNRLLWTEIREDVKEWVLKRWRVWQTQRPEFFTPQFIATVPLDMIPMGAQGEAKVVRKKVRGGDVFSAKVQPIVGEREVAVAIDEAVDEEIVHVLGAVLFALPTPKQLQQNHVDVYQQVRPPEEAHFSSDLFSVDSSSYDEAEGRTLD